MSQHQYRTSHLGRFGEPGPETPGRSGTARTRFLENDRALNVVRAARGAAGR